MGRGREGLTLPSLASRSRKFWGRPNGVFSKFGHVIAGCNIRSTSSRTPPSQSSQVTLPTHLSLDSLPQASSPFLPSVHGMIDQQNILSLFMRAVRMKHTMIPSLTFPDNLIIPTDSFFLEPKSFARPLLAPLSIVVLQPNLLDPSPASPRVKHQLINNPIT